MVSTFLLSSCSNHKRSASRSNKERPVSKQQNLRKTYASKLGVSESEVNNERLYAFIADWEGTPYKYGGSSKAGTDCSGFVGALYQTVYQKQLPRTTSELAVKATAVKRSNLREGDLVFFNINGKKKSHVGVYLMNQRFVHASSSKGVIISALENPYYQKVFDQGRRPR